MFETCYVLTNFVFVSHFAYCIAFFVLICDTYEIISLTFLYSSDYLQFV